MRSSICDDLCQYGVEHSQVGNFVTCDSGRSKKNEGWSVSP